MFSAFGKKRSTPCGTSISQRLAHWNKPENSADCAKIFRHLLNGKSLTNLEAMQMCRMSPHADKRLREVRFVVRLADEYIEANGKRFKRYWMPADERQRVVKQISEVSA